MNSNLKDKITNICAVITAVCVYMLTVGIGVSLPAWANTVFTAIAGICGIVTMILTGKAPNGTTKSSAQVNAGNTDPVIPPKG